MLIPVFISCGLTIFFCESSYFPRFSWSRNFTVQTFQGPGFSGSRFFRVQVFWVQLFQGPVFFGSRSRVQVWDLGPGFKGSPIKHLSFFKTRQLLVDGWWLYLVVGGCGWWHSLISPI